MWLVLGRGVGLIAPFLVLPLAARLLTKEELGVWAIIQVAVGFVAIFQDGGLSPYVIKTANYYEKSQGMVRLCGLLLGFLVGLVLLLISIPLTSLLGIGNYWTLFIPLSGVYLCSGLVGILYAELRKETQFKKIFICSAIPAVISNGLLIGLLLAGARLWAFPIAAVCGAILQLLGLVVFRRPIRFKWDSFLLKELVTYTRGLLGFNLINYWARKLDDVLVGTAIGPAALAVYSSAYRLMMLPLSQVVSLLSPLILPYMAKRQEDKEACREELFGFVKLVGLIAIPPMTFLWLERELLIHWYLGSGWGQVADILFWFAPLGMLQCLINPLGNAFLITGKNDLMFYLGLVNSIITISGFVIGLRFGVEGVAIGYFCANIIMLLPNVYFPTKVLGGSIKAWFFKCGLLWLIPIVGILSAYILPPLSSLLKAGINALSVTLVTLIIGYRWYGPYLATAIVNYRNRRQIVVRK